MEKDLMNLLDIIILMQMLTEKLDDFSIESHYNKKLLKKRVNDCKKEIEPLIKRDYGVVFNNGEEETQQIISEYEELVATIRDRNVPEKVILNQLIQAYNLDKNVMEATSHRILKKNYNKSNN